MRNWKHELSSKTEIWTKTFSEILRWIVRVVNVPLKLISQNNVSNSHIQLDYFHKLSLHLFVLSELVNLLSHAWNNLRFKHCRQAVLFHQNLCKVLQILVWLISIPKKQVFQPFPFKLEIKFDWNERQIGLAGHLVLLGCVVEWNVSVEHHLIKFKLIIWRLQQW